MPSPQAAAVGDVITTWHKCGDCLNVLDIVCQVPVFPPRLLGGSMYQKELFAHPNCRRGGRAAPLSASDVEIGAFVVNSNKPGRQKNAPE